MVLGLFDSAIPYKNQKYSDLRKSCESSGSLFTDNQFPPDSSSLGPKVPNDVTWKRIGELCRDPHFFVDGASADDFSQGELGNCWFVAACACIAEHSHLLKKIVPDLDLQEWNPEKKYTGIFHFRFWRNGKWLDVVVDDYLPTRNGRLVFVHSADRNEYWSPLLEKAYAKLFGNYSLLEAGHTRDALVDMTGGVGENLQVKDFESEEARMELFRILKKSYEYKSLMSASISAKVSMEHKQDNGLVQGHAYSITAARDIALKGTGLLSFLKKEKIHMIRLRNPWGGTEWKGAWSDGSAEWSKVSKSEKKDLGLAFDDNGEFWMSYDDFLENYTNIDICHMINTSFFSLKKTWHEGASLGSWESPNRMGGCGNHETFLQNPQFIFDVTEREDEVLVSLEQFDKRAMDQEQFTIGVTVLKTDLNREYRMHDKLSRVLTTSFSNTRSIFGRVTLKQGRYCMIPSTFDPGNKGEFFIRVYASSDPNFKYLEHDEPPVPSGCGCGLKLLSFCKPYIAVTQINILKAEGLEGQDKVNTTADPYCIVKWDMGSVKTPYEEQNLNPNWDQRVTCYHKNLKKDIIVEVWNYNLLKDQFMGMCVISMEDRQKYTNKSTTSGYTLTGKGKEQTETKPGTLWLGIYHTTDFQSV